MIQEPANRKEHCCMKIPYTIVKESLHHKSLSEPHFHDEYELLFGLSDGGTYMINGHAYPLCHAMLFVLNKYVLHQCIADISSYEKYVLHFSSETLKMLSSTQTDIVSIFGNFDYIAQLLSEEQFHYFNNLLANCMPNGGGFGDDLRQNMAFVNLILYISNLIRQRESVVGLSLKNEYNSIKPIFDYIHNHYMEEIRLEELSQKFFISKYYLCRHFKALTGFSVGSYVTNYRIREACILLRKGYSVQRAWEEVGFGNNAYFIKTFKKTIGQSPGKYAKNY